MKANDELRRKLQQGSQQLQGEVLELALEDLISQTFPSECASYEKNCLAA
jgi:hypothetical protein